MTDDPTVSALLAAVARRLEAAERLTTEPTDALLSAIAGTAVVALDAQAASIAIHDPATDRLVFVAAAGPAAGDVVGLAIDASAGIAGYAFSSGQPLAVADAAADPRFDPSVAAATGYTPSTILAAPLIDADGTVGVLEALDRRGGSFTMRDLDLATAISRTATVAVRARRTRTDARALVDGSLRALLREAGDDALDDTALDDLVAEVTGGLDQDPDDPRWALADRIARLRDVDPDSVELATEWLDALLRRAGRRSTGRSRGRT